MSFSWRTSLTAPLAAFTLSACLVAGLAAPSIADSKDDVKREQSRVEKRLKDAKSDVHEASKELQAASAKVAAANEKLFTAEAKLGKTQGQLAVARARSEELKRELAAAEAELKAAEAEVKKSEAELREAEKVVEQFAVDSLLSGDRGLHAFGALVRGEDPMIITEQMSLNSSIGDAQVSQAQRVEAARVMLEVERAQLEVLRDEISARKAEAEQYVVIMEDLAAQAEKDKAEVAAQKKKADAARADAAGALAAEKRRQDQLQAESRALENRLQAIIRKELEDAKKGGGSTSTGDSSASLSRPVPGIVTSPYGWRKHPILGYRRMHDGTDFRAYCGTPLYSAADGTVDSVFYSSGYGNRVVINNGVKRGVVVHTTYNHLSRFAVSKGQRVKRGQVIGYSGTTGMSTACHLHFQVLVNGAHTNPMNWL